MKPAIREARFDLALAPLRLFVPPSAGELPVLEGAVKLKVLGVDLTHGLRIAKDGTAELHAELERLSWRKAEQSAEISGARIELHAKPSGDGFALELKAPIDSVRAAVAGAPSSSVTRSSRAAATPIARCAPAGSSPPRWPRCR